MCGEKRHRRSDGSYFRLPGGPWHRKSIPSATNVSTPKSFEVTYTATLVKTDTATAATTHFAWIKVILVAGKLKLHSLGKASVAVVSLVCNILTGVVAEKE